MTYLQKKKLAFMSIVNQVKGFVRSVSGTLPLTLEGCVDEESIIDYKIYGQSIQDGEIESVGEKTHNLINWDYLLDDTDITKVDNGYYSEVHRHSFDASSNIVKQLKSVLKPDTTYTLSRICYAINGNTSIGAVSILLSSGYANTGNGQGLKSKTFTFTQEQIDNIIELRVFFTRDGGATISEIQLTESDTVLPYEPYNKYKIPVTVSGDGEPITTNIYLDKPLGQGEVISYKKDKLPTIPTHKGTSIITVDTTIQPSRAEIVYYSNVKE